MIILAIDTSLGPCSVALWQNDAVTHHAREEKPGSQSRVLIPMIEKLLAEAGIGYADCDALACTIGPGGFTGIRTGLASARAIALATKKPLIGLTTLEVIAHHAASATGDIVAAVDAYRDEWYAQRFRMNGSLTPLSEPLLVDEKGLKAIAHGAKIVQGEPAAPHVAALAHVKWTSGERQFPTSPLYIRAPDAKLPGGGLKVSDSLV